MSAIARLAMLSVAGLLCGLPAAMATGLMPHRAVYDLVIDGDSRINDTAALMRGRMVYEFTGSVCQGYSVSFRFVLETQPADGDPSTTDMRTSNFETADGSYFRFLSQTFSNGVLTEDVQGVAKRSDSALEVRLAKPDQQTISMPREAVLPSAHLLRIIKAAEDGQRILTLDTFDGSDGGTHLFKTTAVIGAEITDPPANDEVAIGTVHRWPVVVSYFDSSRTGDLTPDYSAAFTLWDNGVSTHTHLDYGEFALKGEMAHFEALPASTACDDGSTSPRPATPDSDLLVTPPIEDGAPSSVTPP